MLPSPTMHTVLPLIAGVIPGGPVESLRRRTTCRRFLDAPSMRSTANFGDRGCIARHFGRRKRYPDPQLGRRIDVDPFISCSYRLNESQFRLAGHLRGCDFAQDEKYLDVQGRTALSSRPMDQLILWELGSQLLKDLGGKAAGANEKRDLHRNPFTNTRTVRACRQQTAVTALSR